MVQLKAVRGSCGSPGAPGGSRWVTRLCLLEVSACWVLQGRFTLCSELGGSRCHPQPSWEVQQNGRNHPLLLLPAAQQCPPGRDIPRNQLFYLQHPSCSLCVTAGTGIRDELDV